VASQAEPFLTDDIGNPHPSAGFSFRAHAQAELRPRPINRGRLDSTNDIQGKSPNHSSGFHCVA